MGSTTRSPPLQQSGYLNELTIWSQGAADKLEIELGRRRKASIAVSIGNPVDGNAEPRYPLKTAEFVAQRAAGIYDLNFKHAFEALDLKEPRIRSLCIHIVPNNSTQFGKYYQAWITPPANPLAPAQKPIPLLAYAGDLSTCWELSTSELHNLDPTAGNWALKLTSQPVFGPADAADVLQHVVFHFVLSVQRIA